MYESSRQRSRGLHTAAFLKTAQLAAAGFVGDSPLFLLDYLLRVVRVVVLLALWRTILGTPGGQAGAAAAGMSLAAILTYTVVSEAFSEQLNVRTDLDVELRDGAAAMRFLRPVTLVGQLVAEMVGRWGFGLLAFTIPLLLVAPLLGVSPLPASALGGLLFIPSVALGASVGLALEFIFGVGGVVLDVNTWTLRSVRAALTTILSGALIPLALLPNGWGEVFGYLPFAAMASAPLRIYTGTGPAPVLLASQAFWSVVLWLFARRLWSASRERIVGYGG
jgi:ABC-2 type transport system permease protein